MLARSGINLDHQDINGFSALHLASYKGQDDNVEILLRRKVNLNSVDKIGWTPLVYAVVEGQTNAIQMLLDAGADYSVKDVNGDILMSSYKKSSRSEVQR